MPNLDRFSVGVEPIEPTEVGTCDGCGGVIYKYELAKCIGCGAMVHQGCLENCSSCELDGCRCCLKRDEETLYWFCEECGDD